MKRIISLLVSLIIILSAVCVTFAAPSDKEDSIPRLTDRAGLLSSTEEASINARLDDLSDYYGVDICIRTTNDTNGKSVEAYADDFFDKYYSDNGVLLLLVMNTRDWYISTCGSGISAFTDYGISYVGEIIVPYFKEKDYAGGFSEFATQADLLYSMFEQGKPLDSQKSSEDNEFPFGKAAVIAAILGIIAGFIFVGVQKGELKTVRRRPEANEYTKEGSFMLTDSRDMYLYSTVSRIPKPKETDISGGSTTHMSSGGMMHGGGGGKF